MSDFYKFASENPWLAFFLFCVAAQAIVYVFEAIARIFRKD
jgi:hypothetical protein